MESARYLLPPLAQPLEVRAKEIYEPPVGASTLTVSTRHLRIAPPAPRLAGAYPLVGIELAMAREEGSAVSWEAVVVVGSAAMGVSSAV